MSLVVAGAHQRPFALVRSAASPAGSLLLMVRAILQRDEELRALFVRFSAEGKTVEWLRDMLVPPLACLVDGYPLEDIAAACQYLADEYQQLDSGGCFIVDRETGRVQVVVSEDDLFDPGVLARDSGIAGQALWRLNPSLESALVTHYHERGREAQTTALLAQRAHQTDLLREDGDGRLRAVSRGGRTAIAKDLSEEDPIRLLRSAGGSAGKLASHFAIGEAVNFLADTGRISDVAVFHSVLGIQDMTTLNLGYDRLGVLRSVAPQAWLRDIVRKLGVAVKAKSTGHVGPPLSVEDVNCALIETEETWVADPDVYTWILRAHGRKIASRVVPVQGAELMGFSGALGLLSCPDGFGVETRECSDRWEITATLPYILHVTVEKIKMVAVACTAMETASELV